MRDYTKRDGTRKILNLNARELVPQEWSCAQTPDGAAGGVSFAFTSPVRLSPVWGRAAEPCAAASLPNPCCRSSNDRQPDGTLEPEWAGWQRPQSGTSKPCCSFPSGSKPSPAYPVLQHCR